MGATLHRWPSAAGAALQDAGYEAHGLLVEEGGPVYADLERPDGADEIVTYNATALQQIHRAHHGS